MAVEWDFTPVLMASAASALLSGGLTVYAVRKMVRSERNAVLLAFACTMASTAVWSVGQLGVVASVGADAKLPWFYLANVAAFSGTPAFLLLALAYTDRSRWVNWKTVALSATVPVAVAILTITHPYHDLLLADARTVEFAGGSFLAREYGPLFRPLAFLMLAVGFAGIVVLLSWIRRSEGIYREQAVAIVGAVVAPLVAEIVHLTGILPGFFNPTPLSFSISGIFLWVAIFRYQLFDVVPVARDTVVERMRDGFVVLDPDDRVVDSNPAAESVVGRTPIGTPASDVFGDGVNLDGDDPGEITVESDGGERTFEVHVSPLTEEGRDIGRLVTLRDVTGRRHVEKRYQALFEHASDVITVLNEDGSVAYQSPSIERVLGYDRAELVGEGLFEYVHPEDRVEVVEGFYDGIENPDSLVRLEYRFRDADGDYRVVESVGRNLLDNPYVEGVVVNSRDVTERVERERELQEKNERLDEFASVVSHDLRNPLGVAKGYLDVLEEDPETYAAEIGTSLDRMEEIIEDVLTLARQDEAIEETTTVPLDAVARRAWDQVETGDGTLELAGSTEVEADPDRLQQLFENLFRNAVEHAAPATAPDGGETARDGLTVTVGTTEEGFFVADDGPGIAPDQRDRVFESGFTTAADGTGFGLAIVDRIAQAHGWSVSVGESASGGARFDVRVG